ncbi:anti-sigma factor RsgI [Paenibacillus sp. 32O-W]|uniref:anti-sigma factor domain-containing protein n=1 Tax=Paenibacillus sp. 32O-W TaxID=1695218 RepID=UPI0007221532|nr:anti-sigma factor domain-containing protein [Paenibacillus sp. 32O-W]ALS29395.1 anti-sigma factor RsgI [Paenibacillus sp. 32O-W]
MRSGIVVQLGKRHLIVMTRDGEFRKVRRTGACQIGQEIAISPASARSRRPFYAAAAAALLLLLALPLAFIPHTSAQPIVAYLNMDINPSIEIGIDRDDRVWELRGLNDSGAEVVSSITSKAYKGKPVEQVAAVVMERVAETSFSRAFGGEIVITSIVVDADIAAKSGYELALTDKVNDAVRESIRRIFADESMEIQLTTLHAPKELRDEAQQNGVSAGRMALYLMAKYQGKDLRIDELKTTSIHDIAAEWGGVEAIVKNSIHSGTDDSAKEALRLMLESEHTAAEANPGSDTAGAKAEHDGKQPSAGIASAAPEPADAKEELGRKEAQPPQKTGEARQNDKKEKDRKETGRDAQGAKAGTAKNGQKQTENRQQDTDLRQVRLKPDEKTNEHSKNTRPAQNKNIQNKDNVNGKVGEKAREAMKEKAEEARKKAGEALEERADEARKKAWEAFEEKAEARKKAREACCEGRERKEKDDAERKEYFRPAGIPQDHDSRRHSDPDKEKTKERKTDREDKDGHHDEDKDNGNRRC